MSKMNIKKINKNNQEISLKSTVNHNQVHGLKMLPATVMSDVLLPTASVLPSPIDPLKKKIHQSWKTFYLN